jgi:quercetin dioxygenase-like cupin family protein
MRSEASSPAYRLAAGDGLADAWWKGGRVTVKASGRETGGSFSQIELNDPRGTATPWHVHRAGAETFYVLEGELTVLVGDERIDLSAGEFAFAPAGVAHACIVQSEQARTLVTISPPGLEDVFVELGEPITGHEAPAGDVFPPPDLLARRLSACCCDIVGPPPKLDEV